MADRLFEEEDGVDAGGGHRSREDRYASSAGKQSDADSEGVIDGARFRVFRELNKGTRLVTGLRGVRWTRGDKKGRKKEKRLSADVWRVECEQV